MYPSSGQSGRKKGRHKVQCTKCRAVFNYDYKSAHEVKIHGGRVVGVVDVGAPKNPFEAALKKRKVEEITIVDIAIDGPQDGQSRPSEISHSGPVENSMESAIQVLGPSTSQAVNAATGCNAPIEDVPPNLSTPEASLESRALTSEKLPTNSSSCSLEDEIVVGADRQAAANEPAEQATVDECPSWISFMGSFGHLTDKLKECSVLFLKYTSSEIISEKLAIADILRTVSSLQESCNAISEEGTQVLEELEKVDEQFTIDEISIPSEVVPHDPGCRPQKLDDNQRNYLIHLGPHQPRLAVFPHDGKNRFSSKWYEEFTHLEYSTIKDAAFCFVCSLFPSGVGRERCDDAWVSVGVKTWSKMKSSGKTKSGKLPQHFSSQAHRAALSDYCHFLHEKGHINVLLDKRVSLALIQQNKLEKQNEEIIKVLMDVTLTLANQGLPFRGNDTGEGNFDVIVSLLARYFPPLKTWIDSRESRAYKVTYMSNKSQNEMIQILGNEVSKIITKEVNNSLCFSVMADTTPALSHKDIMSIAVRYVDESGEPKERLIKSVECTDKTGQGMAELILRVLNDVGIQTSKIAFQSYDFASSMSGRLKGAQKMLSEQLGYHVPYIPCQDHRTNTALEHACNISLIIREFFNVLEGLYDFFSSSPKRFQHLQEKVSEVGRATHLTNLSKTRWTARAKAIKAFNPLFEEVVELLKEMSISTNLDSNTRTRALGLYKKTTTFDFIVAFYFLKNIMEKVKILTETLETPELNFIDAITATLATADSIQRINSDDDSMNALIQSAVVFAEKVGIHAETDFTRHHRRRLTPKRIDPANKTAAELDLLSFYRKEFRAVIDTLLVGLRENASVLKEKLEPLYSIFCSPLDANKLTTENVERAVALFPYGSPMSGTDAGELLSQLEVLFQFAGTTGEEKTGVKTNLKDVCKLAHKYKAVIPKAYNLCRLCLTAAFGVATNERSFSQLKLIKNHLRTNQADDRLNSLMLLKCEKDITTTENNGDAISAWVRLKKRRIWLPSNEEQ